MLSIFEVSFISVFIAVEILALKGDINNIKITIEASLPYPSGFPFLYCPS